MKKQFEIVCFSLLGAFILLLSGVFIGRNFGDQNYFLTGLGNSASVETTYSDGRIDLNTATESDLTMIPGIGPVLAERIVAYRQEIGAFQSVNELINVPGIGQATLNKLQQYVTVK